jgi:hypothetical protein
MMTAKPPRQSSASPVPVFPVKRALGEWACSVLPEFTEYISWDQPKDVLANMCAVIIFSLCVDQETRVALKTDPE